MRYAIYFTPDVASDLHELGTSWLGRDAASNISREQPDAQLWDLTRHARHYGLHGTLKPPFYLKEGSRIGSLLAAVERLATRHKTFMTSPLVAADMDGYLALTPESHCFELDHLAADCVQHLDDFRAPPSADELQKRRAVGLSSTQEDLLQQWGYPYVLEEFRFHLTLSDRLTDDQRKWVMPLAETHFAPVLGQPLKVDAVSVLVETGENKNFCVMERFLLPKSVRMVA